jgi:TatD DNase family protein
MKSGSASSACELVDTHCHLKLSPLADDMARTLARAREAGVTRIIDVNMELAEPLLLEGVFFACGIHPNEASRWQTEQTQERLRTLILHTKCVAVGEIGLDFYRDYEPADVQRDVFRAQLNIAAECGKPVVIHCREAFEETLQILTDWSAKLAGVHLHCFGGNLEHLRKALDLGFYIGFDGPITYKKAENVRELARGTPLDRILLETDSPYMAPHPHRGKANEPAHLPLIAAQIAEVKGVRLEDVACQTSANAQALFHL